MTAARDVGAAPERCLVFEDSLAGVQGALAAGMRVAALLDPEAAADGGREQYRAAHRIIQSWSEASLSLLDF